MPTTGTAGPTLSTRTASGNGGRHMAVPSRLTIEQSMDAFDRMPAAIRQAYREVSHNSAVNARSLRPLLKKFGIQAVAVAIREAGSAEYAALMVHEFGPEQASLLTSPSRSVPSSSPSRRHACASRSSQ
jgi:hypothetical protein